MLSPTEVQSLAADIFAQHERRETFKPIPDRIPTVADAQDVQDAYVDLLLKKYRTTVGGYKVALTSKRVRDWLKVYEPCARPGPGLAHLSIAPHGTCARIPRPLLRRDRSLRGAGIRDMGGPCTVADVRRNLRSLHCAYELVEDRGADMNKMDARSLASDNS